MVVNPAEINHLQERTASAIKPILIRAYLRSYGWIRRHCGLGFVQERLAGAIKPSVGPNGIVASLLCRSALQARLSRP